MGKFAKTKETDGPVAAMIRRVATSARKRNAQLGLFDADAIVRTLLEELAAELEEKGRLQLPGFGVFTVRRHSPKVVKMFFGKPAHFLVPEKTTVHFSPATALKKKLGGRR